MGSICEDVDVFVYLGCFDEFWIYLEKSFVESCAYVVVFLEAVWDFVGFYDPFLSMGFDLLVEVLFHVVLRVCLILRNLSRPVCLIVIGRGEM